MPWHRRSSWGLFAACWMGLASTPVGWGQVVMHFSSSMVVSPSSPSITLSVENSDPVNSVSIGGVNIYVKVQSGGPTMDISPGVGVDLLTGTLFSGISLGGYFPISPPQTPLEQGWGVAALPAATLAPGQTKQLATITFNSFPTGEWLVDFGDPDAGGTSFSDAVAGDIEANHLFGTVTVVPEPQSYALVAGFGLLAVVLGRRLRLRSR